MENSDTYMPLTVETLPARLSVVAAVNKHVGGDTQTWEIKEIGDGNLNLVFILQSPIGKLIVKQALPYVRLVGDSWPLPLYRTYYEHEALVRQEQRAPGMVPQIYHFDRSQALIVMEFLEPHTILRGKLIAGDKVENLGKTLGDFCARTAFRGSELSMKSADKKADVGIFSGNVEIPAITEALVFTDPYFDAKMNNHTPGLEGIVAKLRGDARLKQRVQKMLMKFASNTETLLHGDLHSGSIMSTSAESMIIDPEFAQYGPLGFDIGMLTANLLMAYFSQPAHRSAGELDAYQAWILTVITETARQFNSEFTSLWNTERTGMLYSASLFEDQGQSSQEACDQLLADIWRDAIVVCGIEMHRRVLSLAHNADFERIEDESARARLEARNIAMGMELILKSEAVTDVTTLTAMAERFNQGDYL